MQERKKSCDNDVGNNIGWRVINDTATDDDQIYGTWQDEEIEGFQDSRVIGENCTYGSQRMGIFSPLLLS